MSFKESADRARDLMMETRSPGVGAAHRIEAARVHAELAKAEAFHELAAQLGNIAQAIARGQR